MLYYVNGNKTSSLENNLVAVSVLASFEKITNLLIDILRHTFFQWTNLTSISLQNLTVFFFLSEATQNHYERRIGVPTRFC